MGATPFKSIFGKDLGLEDGLLVVDGSILKGNIPTLGKDLFVDSVTGSDNSDGRTPKRALATLDAAVGLCTANKGYRIICLPNHAETLTGDSGVDLDVAGITVIGLGHGSDRPTFDFTTATAADFKIAAADVGIHNLLFTSGIASQAMMIETSGDDFEISHCEFRNNASTQSLILVNVGVGSNDSDRGYIHDCVFLSDTANATSAISITALQAELRIENNYIRGDFSDAAVQSAVIHTDCVVKGNYIQNDNNTAHAIQFSTTSTGMIKDNTLVTDAIATSLDQGSCFAEGNLYYDDGDTDATGTPVPTTATTGGTTLETIDAAVTVIDEYHDVPAADATANAQINEVIGNKTDTASQAIAATDSLMSYAKGLMASTVRTIASQAVGTTTTPKTLFTITGGSIHVISIVGTVVTQMQGQACTQQIQAVVTNPSATVNMSTAVETNGDVVGTTYHFLGETGVLTPVTAGLIILPLDDAADGTDKPTQWIVPIGLIGVDASAVSTGDVDWVMTYYHNPLATVVAA